MTTLEIHLSTDVVTGDLTIDFHPPDDEYMPMDVEDWPPVRKELRDEVRDKLDDPIRWETYLHSDRIDRRFDVTIGSVEVYESGEWFNLTLTKTEPADLF